MSEVMHAEDNVLVSVVVTTKNEEKNIEMCLESIRHQLYSPIELIVVDNNSIDKTKEIALRYTPLVYDFGPERSAQRNFGILNIAKGRYAMFIDADMLLSPYLVKSCVQSMRGGIYVALHIPEIVLGKNFFSKVRRFERAFYDGTVIDGSRFFLREAFVKAGGFDETLSGPEDWDLDKKIKQLGKIGLLNSCEPEMREQALMAFILERGVDPKDFGAVVYHNESEFSISRYLEKKGYYSKSLDKYACKWGYDESDIKKQLGAYYRLIGIFIENGKYKRLLAHPLLACGMYYLRLRVAWKYIQRY
jgi:glycosyltransferase involved in cell wall biosynthesis